MEASQVDKSDSTNSSFTMLNSDQIKDEVFYYIKNFNIPNNKVNGINEIHLTNENTNHFMINSEELPKGLVISSLD